MKEILHFDIKQVNANAAGSRTNVLIQFLLLERAALFPPVPRKVSDGCAGLHAGRPPAAKRKAVSRPDA